MKLTFRLRCMLFLLVGSIIVLAASYFNSPAPEIAPDLKPFVDAFISEAESRGLDIPYPSKALIIFGKDSQFEDGSVGLCYMYVLGRPLQIFVDKRYWSHISMAQKTVLMYHELAHCLLNKEHTSVTMPENDFCPNSIMNPSIINEECFNKYYNHYLNELFK